jgi:hypothetical protein
MQSVRLDAVRLAHFPIRSVAQIQAKALLGWTTMLALDFAGRGGFQWERMYADLVAQQTWTQLDLTRHALAYVSREGSGAEQPVALVEDPLEPVERRYVEREMTLLEVCIALTRQLSVTLRTARSAERTHAAAATDALVATLLGDSSAVAERLAGLMRERDAALAERQCAEAERDAALLHAARERALLQGPSGP